MKSGVKRASLSVIFGLRSTAEAAPAKAGVTKSICFHCGLPVPPNAEWEVSIGQFSHRMCCPGCQAVAQSIVDNGFGDYYSTRTEFSATAGQDAPTSPEFQLYDANPIAGQIDVGEQSCEAMFSVEGIRCAACVWLIERRLGRLPGVQSVELNVAAERLHLLWNRDACKPSDILKALREIGYAAFPFDADTHGERLEHARKILFRRLFIAGLSMMQVMMYALPIYLAADGTMDRNTTNLMRWAGLLLTLPAVAYSAQPFYKGAWLNLKNRMLGMDVPVSLGIAAAFFGSLLATWRGDGEVYFDSITMFVFLLLCSRYLEIVVRRKAASVLDNLQHALPASALRVPGYPACRETELISAAQLQQGDVILVKPGQAIAADGIVLEGDTAVDLSLLTGESRAQRKTVGADLPGGAVNAEQPIIMRVTRSVGNSTLSILARLIERAGQGKPQLSLWADKVAAWFVALLLLFAIAVFVAWQCVDPSRAWPIAVAVLVVSCPCALSLATPTALAVATDRLVRQGILIVQPHVLETMHRATHIVFDKTGTLTVGKPVLRQIKELGTASSAWCLQVAAALEASGAHPLAIAIVAAANKAISDSNVVSSVKADMQAFAEMQVGEVRHVVGQGLEGTVNGILYRLGGASFVASLVDASKGGSPERQAPDAASDMTSIYLGAAGAWLARFDLTDDLRADAQQVVNAFRAKGKTVIVLSGDRQAVSRQVADRLGIDAAFGDYLPDRKLAFVKALQRGGAVVAMVGDGVNDAAVLRAADVSFAMGEGAALAQTHADCVLLSGRLSSLCEVADTASRTLSIIRQNLVWAALYNMAAIPAAALGLLNPWLSGIGMSLSSAVVVINALRLRRVARRTLSVDASSATGCAIAKSLREN